MRYYRNTIVRMKGTGFAHYGRINKVLPDNQYEVIDCGRHVSIVDHDVIEADGYKGLYDWGHEPDDKYPRFRHMTTLRRLKQKACIYNPDVWRKPQYKIIKNDERISHDLVWEARCIIIEQGVIANYTVFHGKRLRDHNYWRRYLLHDVLVTSYRAQHRPVSMHGKNWHILISKDYTEMVEIHSGNVEDIKRDLFLIKLSG